MYQIRITYCNLYFTLYILSVGSGKTALVSSLAGQLKPYIGDVILDGELIDQCHDQIAFVQARDLFLPTLTVKETLMVSNLDDG